MPAASTLRPRPALPPCLAFPLAFEAAEARTPAAVHRGVERSTRLIARIRAQLAALAPLSPDSTTEVSFATEGAPEPTALTLPVATVRAALALRLADAETLLARWQATAAAIGEAG